MYRLNDFGMQYFFVLSQIEFLKKTISRFYGETSKNLKNLSRNVNKHQFERLRNILEDPSVAASTVHGGSLDEKNPFFASPIPIPIAIPYLQIMNLQRPSGQQFC